MSILWLWMIFEDPWRSRKVFTRRHTSLALFPLPCLKFSQQMYKSAKYWIGLIFPDHNNYTHLITMADIGKGSGSLLSNKTGRAKEVVIVVSNIKKSRILEIWTNPKISESFTMSQDILFFCVSSVSRSKINPRPGHGFRNKTPKESSSSHLSFSAILSLSHQNGSV